jgi:hypothetical protein
MHDKYIGLFIQIKAIHEDTLQSPLSTHSFAESFLSELTLLKPTAKEEKIGAPAPSLLIWIPPPENCAKVNVDARVARNGVPVWLWR